MILRLGDKFPAGKDLIFKSFDFRQFLPPNVQLSDLHIPITRMHILLYFFYMITLTLPIITIINNSLSNPLSITQNPCWKGRNTLRHQSHQVPQSPLTTSNISLKLWNHLLPVLTHGFHSSSKQLDTLYSQTSTHFQMAHVCYYSCSLLFIFVFRYLLYIYSYLWSSFSIFSFLTFLFIHSHCITSQSPYCYSSLFLIKISHLIHSPVD